MFSRLAILGAAAVLAIACGQSGSSATAPATSERFVPRGATLGPGGYATIIDVPPAPFTPVAPGHPKPPTAEQIAAQQQFARITRFQARVLPEVHALANHLRLVEKGNFVDFHFDNEGEPSAVFQFLRDGRATLRKYTSNPGIVAETVRFSKERLMAAMDFMLETFREDRVIESGGIGAANAVAIRINIPEEHFRALVAKKGVTIPEEVRLEFPVERPASVVNAPLPPDIAPLVRIFPRDDRPTGPVPDTSRIVKVELRDGCFRLADHGNALALFPLGAQLFVDDENYLAFGPEGPGYARVGEKAEFHGIPVEVTAPELVDPIHGACGPGKVLKVNHLRSAAAARAQDRVTTNARAVKEFTESYGLTEAQARKLLEQCKRHVGGDVCLTSPPPPVLRQEDCPADTRLSGGLCRTSEGHIRPLPKWLRELLDE